MGYLNKAWESGAALLKTSGGRTGGYLRASGFLCPVHRVGRGA